MIYLGTITLEGSDCENNLATDVNFTIGQGWQALLVQPSAATIYVALKASADATFLPSDTTTMRHLDTAEKDFYVDGLVGLGPVTLAARKSDSGSGTLKVFGIR